MSILYEIYFGIERYYNKPIINQTVRVTEYFKQPDITGNMYSCMRKVCEAERILRVSKNSDIKTIYYEANGNTTIDFIKSCDKIIRLLTDKNKTEEIWKLYRTRDFLSYLRFVVRNTYKTPLLVNDIEVQPEDMPDLSSCIDLSFCKPTYRYDEIKYKLKKYNTKRNDIETLYCSIHLCVRCKKRYYLNNDKILRSFCDTFVNNLPKAKRIALLG